MISPDLPPIIESLEPALIHRREVLGTLGRAALAVLASSIPAQAYSSAYPTQPGPKVSTPTSSAPRDRSNTPIANLPDLPEEWIERQGHLAIDYVRYLNSLNMQHVCPTQVLESHAQARGKVWNSLPPKAWWNRIGYTLRVVNRIAREMNVSQVEVISAYRCPAYNAHCSGARANSWHQVNIAVDVKFPVRASKVTATARELRDLGLFRGGVGGYWNFTHIDCRGQNINW